MHAGEGGLEKRAREDQISVFDIDIQDWRSFRFSSVLQVKF